MSNRWTVLALLFLVRTCMGLQFQSVAAVSPLYLSSFAVSVADVGLLIGLYHAPGIALALPGGGLGRRYGERAVVAFGLALMSAGSLTMAMTTDWSAQVTGRLVAGVGAVLMNVLMTKMVADWFAGREIATAMGIFVNSWPFGVALGLLVSPPLASSGGLAGVQMTMAVAITVALAALLAWYRPPTEAASTMAGGGMPRGRALAATIIAGSIWGFYNAALGVIFSFGPLLLTERGWTLGASSSATSLVLWLVAISVPSGGFIADRTGRPLTVLVASAMAFVVALEVAARSDAVITSFVALGLVGGLAAGAIMSLPTRVLGPATRSIGMGVFFTMFYLIQAIGPWIAGSLVSALGRADAAFDTGAVYLAVALGLTGLFALVDRASTASAQRR
jgi:MFS family permease